MCVCGDFVSFTEAENACEQRLLSHGTLTGKTSALLFRSEKYHQLRTFSTGIGPKRDPKTGPSFSTFLIFVCLLYLDALFLLCVYVYFCRLT